MIENCLKTDTIHLYRLFSVHGTNVTANNSTNNNLVLFYFRFQNSILKQLLICDHNLLDKRGKIF